MMTRSLRRRRRRVQGYVIAGVGKVDHRVNIMEWSAKMVHGENVPVHDATNKDTWNAERLHGHYFNAYRRAAGHIIK